MACSPVQGTHTAAASAARSAIFSRIPARGRSRSARRDRRDMGPRPRHLPRRRGGADTASVTLVLPSTCSARNFARTTTLLHRCCSHLRDKGFPRRFSSWRSRKASCSTMTTQCWRRLSGFATLARVKIDHSLIQGVLESDRDAAVIRAFLHMAHSIDVETTA